MAMYSNQRPAAATVQWSSIQTNLEEADSDVLILLDCCAAASSAGGSGNGVTELIAACGFEAYAPGVGEHSFTRSLIEELKYYGQRPGPISTAFLHNKVLARAKNSWNPRYVSNGTQERRKTPIHIHLADRSKQRCIELTPLKFPPKLRDFFSLRLSDTQFFTPSSSPSEDTEMLDPSRSSQTSLDEVWPDPEHNSPKVLISVALEEDQFLRTEDWLDYLKSVPALAKSVRIESVFKSDSILLLLSLPVAIWDMLPKDPAISFVAFVKSGNFLDHRSSNEKVLEMKKRAQEESQVQTAQSINKRYVSPSRYSSPVSSYGSPDSRVIETTKAPTYIKIHRKYLEQGTLDEFKLPWERDRVS